MIVYLVPDTNALIHYKFFEIVWREHLKADEIRVFLCAQVIQEISSMKDMGDRKAIRKRASTLCDKIKTIINSKKPYRLREFEYAEVSARRPALSKYNHLDDRSQDDRIIAAALDLAEMSGAKVVVATADTSLTLRIRLHEIGIDDFELPMEMRLQLSDEDDKRMRQLEEEVQRYKRAQPALAAVFENGERVHRIRRKTVEEIRQFAADSAASAEANAREAHSLRSVPKPSFMLRVGITRGEPVTEEEVLEFNRRLHEYYTAVYQCRQHDVLLLSRAVIIKIRVLNTGTLPASSVRARFRFPDGIKLVDQKELSNFLAKPPKPPKSEQSKISDEIQEIIKFQKFPELDLRSYDGELNIIEDTTPIGEIEFQKIRQNDKETIDDIYVIFEDKIKSFHINYDIVADNCLDISAGQLAVIVQDELS